MPPPKMPPSPFDRLGGEHDGLEPEPHILLIVVAPTETGSPA
jgi:hypothetical protein